MASAFICRCATHYNDINGAYAPNWFSSLGDLDLLELGLRHTADRAEVRVVEFAEGHELLVVIVDVSAYFASVYCHGT